MKSYKYEKFKYNIFVLISYIVGRKTNYNLVRVITYHNINDSDNDIFSVSTSEFAKQIKLLKELNYKTVSIEEIFNNKYKELNEKIIYITFDDGFKDIYKYAIPILEKYNYKATFFITTDFITNEKNSNYLSWKEVQNLNKLGYNIGIHSHRHMMLSKLCKEEIKADIQTSQKLFYENLEFKSNLYSIPYGKKNSFNDNVINLLKEAGFDYIFTQINGPITKNTSKYLIPRNNISGFDSLTIFKRKLEGYFDFYRNYIKAP